MSKKIAVIGCGYWGKNLVRNFSQLGSLKCVFDPDVQISNKMAEAYDVDSCSLDDILLDDDIKGVVIAAPATKHFPLAQKCMQAGKNVFVEKPLALDINDAEILINLSKKRNLNLMVGHLLQYHPAFIELLRICRNGLLGDISYISSTRHSFGKIRREEDVIWSFAPHDISMVLSLADSNPKEVFTHAVSIYQKNIADKALINLAFGNSLKADISVSWTHPVKEQKVLVIGNKGLAIFDDRQEWQKKLFLTQTDIQIDSENFKYDRDNGEFVKLEEVEPLRNECKYFLDLIEGKIPPRTDGDEGLKVLKILKAASVSARKNQIIQTNE